MSFRSFTQQYPLVFYILLNYALSWTFLYPCYQAILNAEEGTFPMLALIGIPGGFGPSIAAVIVVALNEGREGVGRLFRRFKSFKVHWKWYLVVITLPVGLYYLATISTVLFGFDLGNAAYGEGLKMALVYLLLALPFGPLMEELGWRGYMLPALLQRYHVFKSSLILGFCWALWHLASFTFPGAAIPAVFEVNAWTVLLYFLTIMSETLVFSYVYLRTKGSLVMAILLHAAFNAGSTIVLTMFPDISEQVDQRTYLYIIHIVLILLAATGLFGFSRKVEEDLTY